MSIHPPDNLDQGTNDGVDKIVAAYLSLNLPESDDPIDDGIRLLTMITGSDTERNKALANAIKTVFPQQGTAGITKITSYLAAIAEQIEPRLNAYAWKAVFSRVFSGRYGGTTVYIKRRPGSYHREAKRLTPKQIMEKYKVSRAHAYRILSNK